MPDYYYNFQMGEQNRGYYFLRHEDELLFSYTRFYLDENEIFTNIFQLKIQQDRVLAFKYRSDEWVDIIGYSADYYPSSAYPLFLSKALQAPYTYTAVYEGDNTLLGKTLLTPTGNDIIETRDGKFLRRFTMKNNIPIAIDWGGSVSRLCANAAEAIADSGLEFTVEI